MAKPPYFPFYPKDFAADDAVELMSTKAVGAYILLLCKAWHQDPPASLPNDDRVLARWSRLEPDDWREVKPEVVAAFTVGSDGRIHQKRLRKEYEAFAVKSQKARASAEKRWQSERNANAYANALPTHCKGNARASGSGSGSDSGAKSSGGSAEGGECAPIPPPLDTPAFRQAWSEWHDYRAKSRLKPWKRITQEKQLKELAKHGESAAIAAIELSIRNGWQGIFPERGPRASGSGPQSAADARRAEKARREYAEDAQLRFK